MSLVYDRQTETYRFVDVDSIEHTRDVLGDYTRFKYIRKYHFPAGTSFPTFQFWQRIEADHWATTHSIPCPRALPTAQEGKGRDLVPPA